MDEDNEDIYDDPISQEILDEFNEFASGHYEDKKSINKIFSTFAPGDSTNRGFGLLQRATNNYRRTRHFTRSQASEIKKRLIAGQKIHALAKEVGCYNSTIVHIMWGDYYWEIEPFTPHQVAIMAVRVSRQMLDSRDLPMLEKYNYYPPELIKELIPKI